MKPMMILPLALVAAAVEAKSASPSEVEYFRREGSTAPFSPAVRVGDTLYLSGMIGARTDGTLPEGIEAQTRQTMDNISGVLAMAGQSFADVVRCTVMLDNMADWLAFNRVYATYFEVGRLPARSAFGADGLALGALVEVECQAHVPAAASGERGR